MWQSRKGNFVDWKSSDLLLGNSVFSFPVFAFLEKEHMFFFINWYTSIFASFLGHNFLSENKPVFDSFSARE